MKILLINPNAMKNPPVVPLGLEYLVTALENHGYDVDLLDLCFESSPAKKLTKTIQKTDYDIVGITIRNIDSTVYYNNEFYLPKIQKIVQCAKTNKKTVILGGAGFSAMPYEVLEYLKADYGIIGSGERMFPLFLDAWKSGKINERIFDGQRYGPDIDLVHKRGSKVDYLKYLASGGIGGFETHRGCSNQCPCCVEANTRVWYKKIQNIIGELRYLVAQGINHFHLCDCEFNTNLNFSIEFCKALVEADIPLKWALYMKPSPYNEELYEYLQKSNAYLITLSVESDERIQNLNNYSYEDLAQIIQYCKQYGIKLAIDLLTGYPNESIESTNKIIQFFKENRPTTVGVSFYYRIYKNTPIAELIKKDSKSQIKLTRPFSKNETFLEPIFYHQYTQEHLEKLIGEDEVFTIAGITPGVNYQNI
jgi:radical SAM superfamily enzyme YgiQ (UPF0313 family)